MAASVGCYHNNTPTLQPAFAMATHPHDAWGLGEQSGVTITTAPTNTNPVRELSKVPSAQTVWVGVLLPHVPWPTSSRDMFHFDFIPSQLCQSHPPLLKNVQGKKSQTNRTTAANLSLSKGRAEIVNTEILQQPY